MHVTEALVEGGASVVVLADTIGKASPDQIRSTLNAVRSRFAELPLGLHLHDTFGMGLANVRAGLESGIRRFDASLGGIGGCPFAPGAPGNVATETIVEMLHGERIATGVEEALLARAQETLADAIGPPLTSGDSAPAVA